MILYQLRCASAHTFDAWFRNSAAYDDQAARGIVACPTCGDTKVEKAIMAPRIRKRSGREEARRAVAAEAEPQGGKGVPAASPGGAAAMMTPKLRELLLAVRQHIEQNCEHVGPRFAEEARAIHYGETEQRNIYGEATEAEAEALLEEGIDVGRVPWIDRGN